MMRESRRCTSEVESTGGDIAVPVCAIDVPLLFPAWGNDDTGTERNTATMREAAKKNAGQRGFMGILRLREWFASSPLFPSKKRPPSKQTGPSSWIDQGPVSTNLKITTKVLRPTEKCNHATGEGHKNNLLGISRGSPENKNPLDSSRGF
jgi:hypothetical protein